METGTWTYYGLQRLADNNTIFVAPQGLNNGWGNSGGEDVTFVDNMISQIEGALCVDTSGTECSASPADEPCATSSS
ncbi:hypothetical protein [Streptomyces sp. NPDC021212]|uniref:hypothetical protein n=1 Tax=Streptomyces sp. NPDC021212 TaxID=3365118 RepID=UPI0037BC1E05